MAAAGPSLSNTGGCTPPPARPTRERRWTAIFRELTFWALIAMLAAALPLVTAPLCEKLAYAFALLPAVVALANFVFIGSRGFDRESHSIESVDRLIPNFKERYPAFRAVLQDLDKYAPRFPAVMIASTLLSAIYAVAVFAGLTLLTPFSPCGSTHAVVAPCSAVDAGVADTSTAGLPAATGVPDPSSRDAIPAATTASSPAPTATATPDPTKPTAAAVTPGMRIDFLGPEAVYGFVFAMIGAYIQTLLMMIGRINSTALTAKFLFNAALRSAIASVLGMAAAQMSLFRPFGDPNQLWFFYFATGLFPIWALQWVREKVRAAFAHDEQGCRVVPVCLIDGLDDGIIERLAEIGAWDIQHLATMNPIELTMRTLYPLPRVLDWVHQALLINFVGSKITIFRSLGVRGAIDMAVLYADSAGLLKSDAEDPTARKARANALLKALAQKAEMPDDALLAMARLLFSDNLVCLVWELSSGTDSRSVLNEAMSIQLRQVIRQTAMEAAERCGVPFNPDPPVGTPLVLPVEPAFELELTELLNSRLRTFHLRWTGSMQSLRGISSWEQLNEAITRGLAVVPAS